MDTCAARETYPGRPCRQPRTSAGARLVELRTGPSERSCAAAAARSRGIEKQQLGVVDGAAVALVDTYRSDHTRLRAGFAQSVGGWATGWSPTARAICGARVQRRSDTWAG